MKFFFQDHDATPQPVDQHVRVIQTLLQLVTALGQLIEGRYHRAAVTATVITVELIGLDRTGGARRLHGWTRLGPASPKAGGLAKSSDCRDDGWPRSPHRHNATIHLPRTTNRAGQQLEPIGSGILLGDTRRHLGLLACIPLSKQGLRLQRCAAGAAGAAGGRSSRCSQSRAAGRPARGSPVVSSTGAAGAVGAAGAAGPSALLLRFGRMWS